MKKKDFINSCNEATSLLQDLNMLKEYYPHHKSGYSKQCASYSRDNNYREIYHNLVDHRDYDILLFDDSMIQMSMDDSGIRLMYIQNPVFFLPFEDFLKKNGINEEEDIRCLKNKYNDEYNQCLAEMPNNPDAVYFRYDVHQQGRRRLIHAYTHLHIGINNDIRIPVGIELTPLAFLILVIQQVYGSYWKKAVDDPKIMNRIINHKNKCMAICENLWEEDERKFLFIS